MSHFATAWAMQQTPSNPTAKLVLLVLADCHNSQTGLCCPRRSTIARRACIKSEKTVGTALNLLEEQGYITRKHSYNQDGLQRANNYELCMPDPSVLVNTPKMQLKAQNETPKESPAEVTMWDVYESIGGKRSLLGRVVKQHGAKKVAAVVAQLAVSKPADPNSALVDALKVVNEQGESEEFLVPHNDAEVEAWRRKWGYPQANSHLHPDFRSYKNFLWEKVRERKSERAA